ncbi:phosphonate metabolism protein/1,5-bisphosphokinase (PRPP-forming) PhnN [Marinobacterium arenosum]|uniref:phosphonate metabolism protein/1,5-bisphosphokinase (PRPP-forming) PhnN n=1 Tax=Marinobacterium arenosum TaxID=2862496 RepID=UPI001C94B3E4|nr:phosphonate metabolism protein/1,5-bisphosphokinase (PRPP-forming) PhnN [Marinobacterium arenosum]MBY4676073.1 phosphonate metabolism protein/1,5-bisphosphokinase (PRPP-forming) PhnN [Marinobacterium arenosum]
MSGTLFYLIGASGSGKDSLLAGCRKRLLPHHRCTVAHRYITRAADIGGENHIQLSEAEFDMRAELGMFAMQWQSHGYRYAIGSEIEQWLAKGINVLVNGSRAHLAEAIRRYPKLVPVLVEVDASRLRQRLRQRGRESDAEIEQRLAHHARLATQLPPQTRRIDNNGRLEDAVEALLDIVVSDGWQPG